MIVLKYGLLLLFLQIPVEEFTVLMISQGVDDVSQHKPDRATKQL